MIPMPYEIYRIGKRLLLCAQADGSTVLKSVDEMEQSELIAEVMEHRLLEILAVTDKFNEFLTSNMSTREKLASIVAATAIVGPIPTDPDTAENALAHKKLVDASSWHWLLSMARARQWVPKGTRYPSATPVEDGWDGSYTIPAGQSMDYEDTANFCRALRAALEEESLGEPRGGSLDADPREIVADFVEFCSGGYSLTIW
jgi:hypothetical protein